MRKFRLFNDHRLPYDDNRFRCDEIETCDSSAFCYKPIPNPNDIKDIYLSNSFNDANEYNYIYDNRIEDVWTDDEIASLYCSSQKL